MAGTINRVIDSWITRIGFPLLFVAFWVQQPKYLWLLYVAAGTAIALVVLPLWFRMQRPGANAAKANRSLRKKLVTFFDHHPVAEATYLDASYQSPAISDWGEAWGEDVDPRDNFFIGSEEVEVKQAKAAIRKARAAAGRNEIQLILMEPPADLNGAIAGYRADHILARTLEGFRAPPSRMMQLTGNAVVASKNGSHVLIMHKGKHEFSSGRHHILGGAFDPMFDADKIANTAQREVREETGHEVEIAVANCPLILHHQHQGNYMMVTYLGASAAYEPREYGSAEGKVRWVPMEALPDILLKQTWAATGKQAILAWLAVGAPVNGQRTIGRHFRAKRLLREYLAHAVS
jgi:ADP-ribose pyrophosphatase YjhB (NUDIX family)